MYPPQQEQRIKAALGIILGLLIAGFTAYMCHETWIPDQGSKWAFLIILALPIIAWGCSHLAHWRGYPPSVAHSLVFVAIVAATIIGFNQEPKAIGLAFAFIGFMPPVVISALPVRFAAMRRSKLA